MRRSWAGAVHLFRQRSGLHRCPQRFGLTLPDFNNPFGAATSDQLSTSRIKAIPTIAIGEA
ncbi:hypothetical protein OAO92_09190 [Paracoccaceae bacterium]|nr:hypothetical protein [Paracoccaceae bacterium]